jgi:N-acylneuraminate cytidylyltransferase
MWTIEENSFLKPLISGYGDEPYNQPRQSLPQVFWQTGYVDAIRPRVIQNGSMSGMNILPLVIDDGDWIDIDSPADWQMAENLLRAERIKTEALGFSMSGVLPA